MILDTSIVPGHYYIEFVGKEGGWIHVDRVIVDASAVPLYLISGNTYYNWSNVISMRTYT